ncbi:MAG: (Fe-S)-binding protein [Gemmatimonadota bacterium]
MRTAVPQRRPGAPTGPADRSRLSLARSREALLTCVHCGLCLPACPTFRMLGDENDSPRGRIYLMRAAAEGRVGTEHAFRLHIDRCLGCRACETVCPAGVEFGALLERARADARTTARTRAVSGLLKRLRGIAARGALWSLTGGARRVTYPLLRLLRRSGIARAARHLPGRTGTAAALLHATAPAPLSLPSGTLPAVTDPRGVGAQADDVLSSSPAGEGGESGAPEELTASVSLLRGCVMEGLFAHVQAATRATLAAAGYREVPMPGQGCCGALHAHAGFPETARRMARRNIRSFEASGAEWLVADSAGCGAALREYDRWLAEDGAWKRRARAAAARVRDITQLLAAAPHPLGGRLRGSIAYDAPCHLLHAQGVREEPLTVLRRIDGARVDPLPSASDCCGGAGVYGLLHPGLAGRALAPKVEEIRAGAYDWVATGNPGCIMHLGAGLWRAGLTTRAVHPVELLHAALAAR